MAFNITSHTKPEDITGYTYRGAPITLNKTPGNVFRPSDYKHWKKNMFPPKVQTHAAVLYAVTGSLAKASEIAKVPLGVLKQWKQEPWFYHILAEVRRENSDKLDAKISTMLENVLEKLEHRIEDGDTVMDRHGETHQIPVKAKDLVAISNGLHKQRALDRGSPTSISADATLTTEDKLQKLAHAFMQITAKKNQPVAVLEEEPIEAEVEEIPKLQFVGPPQRHEVEAQL